MFESWYDQEVDKARPISDLIAKFAAEGNAQIQAACDAETYFSAADWNGFAAEKQQEILLKYRLTYLAETEVNWCPALGTVLANDEIVNGVSERGGHPVVRKKMMQWNMHYHSLCPTPVRWIAKIDWPQPLKDSQINWIGRSMRGASVRFKVKDYGTGSKCSPPAPTPFLG